MLYFFDEARTTTLLHSFTKATASIEEADKKIGRTRMASHEAAHPVANTFKPATGTNAKETKRR